MNHGFLFGARPAGDGLSLGIAIGSLAEYLPAAAAALSILWTAIRIYESRTVQRLIGRKDD